jgi:hypothetical protein
MDLLLNKGIIPSLMGGLGNQLFILIAAYVAHKYHNCPLYLFDIPKDINLHNINNLDYKNSIFKYFGTHINKIFDRNFIYSLLSYEYTLHIMTHDEGFKCWNPESMPPGTITSSYYQYYPTIKPYEKEIRELLLKGLNEYPNKSSIDSSEHSAFLHIRRGDYLNNPHIHYIQPLEYYQNAINTLLSKKSIEKIYVFSDDINWVKSVPIFNNNLFEIIDSTDELYSLHLMSQCKGGAICANSTFSWWGAFLGAYSERNPVIVPQKWISLHVESLFPEEWIIV